jgi:hypothetical protein
MISKSTWGWIFTAVFFFSYLIVLSMLRGAETQVKRMNQTLDSLKEEIIYLEDRVDAREEEVRILMDLNKDDFDRLEEVDKLERILKDE